MNLLNELFGILTVLFWFLVLAILYVSPILGIIGLLIAIKKKNRIGIILSLSVLLVIASIWLIILSNIERPAHDARVESDLRQFSLAMEMAYGREQRYLTSTYLPTQILTTENEYWTVPPRSIEKYSYNWIDNSNDDQRFCVWAKLPQSKEYFFSTQEGITRIKTLDSPPHTLDDCDKIFHSR